VSVFFATAFALASATGLNEIEAAYDGLKGWDASLYRRKVISAYGIPPRVYSFKGKAKSRPVRLTKNIFVENYAIDHQNGKFAKRSVVSYCSPPFLKFIPVYSQSEAGDFYFQHGVGSSVINERVILSVVYLWKNIAVLPVNYARRAIIRNIDGRGLAGIVKINYCFKAWEIWRVAWLPINMELSPNRGKISPSLGFPYTLGFVNSSLCCLGTYTGRIQRTLYPDKPEYRSDQRPQRPHRAKHSSPSGLLLGGKILLALCGCVGGFYLFNNTLKNAGGISPDALASRGLLSALLIAVGGVGAVLLLAT
jgi:hypothetical protein